MQVCCHRLRIRAIERGLTRRVREIDNVRAALDWSFSSPGDIAIGVDLTAAYAPAWLHLSLMQECRERCERALRGLAPESASHARLQMWLQIGLGNSLLHTAMQGHRENTRRVAAGRCRSRRFRRASTVHKRGSSPPGRRRRRLECDERFGNEIGNAVDQRNVRDCRSLHDRCGRLERKAAHKNS